MASRVSVPKSELQSALEEYGRCARQLSVGKLLASKEGRAVLVAVGTEDQLADSDKFHDLGVQVEARLRAVIASITDRVDRRIAEAVLATEEEFFEKQVERRKQYLHEHDGISDDVYKTRRPRVIGEVAIALERAMNGQPSLQSCSETTPHDADQISRARVETGTVDPRRIVDTAPESGSRARSGRRRVILTGAAASGVAVLAAAGLAVGLTHGNVSHDPWNGMTAAELERRYDGKLPWGDDDNSHCANPPSAETAVSNSPPVMAPNGNQAGVVQLRKSPICPTAVWARVLWNGNDQSEGQIPPGWTLHSVMRRPDTKTVIDEQDHSYASKVPEIVSRMIASAGGCVYAEVYFTKDANPDVKAAIARTSCVRA